MCAQAVDEAEIAQRREQILAWPEGEMKDYSGEMPKSYDVRIVESRT